MARWKNAGQFRALLDKLLTQRENGKPNKATIADLKREIDKSEPDPRKRAEYHAILDRLRTR
ncbi:hypothetical protein [Amycolatopsis panacis]|uniref:Uncharacterized protein n=1 Tax=Amycolatopsis panacis TaxID=2340917 RepID=A0A419I3J1_9PSEU|nr:hypothetical protein [Amycolatopsis panacis]RJQ84752.1 hypothetical protein D5S19_15925 [Amycolatopsis panacis]